MVPGRARINSAAVIVSTALVLLAVAGWITYPYFSFQERFRRSKPALDAYAARVNATGTVAINAPPGRLGYFNVLKVEPLPHGFLFQSDYSNSFDWVGIAYSREPLPESEQDAAGNEKQVFKLIQGRWYTVFRP